MPATVPSEVTWQTVWKELNRLDKILLALFLLAVVCVFLPLGLGAAVAQVAAFFLGAWLGLRVIRRFLRMILWRVRNRLLVAYGFIALVPIALLASLSMVLLYGLVGQTAIFMVQSELERHTALLVASAQHIAEEEAARRIPAAEHIYPVLVSRVPGLELLVEGDKPHRIPAGAAIEAPSPEWGDAGGLAFKQGQLYAWAHIVRPGARVTMLAPLTDSFLAGLAPNIGEITFLRVDDDLTRNRGRMRLRRSVNGEEELDAPRNRVPPKERRYDIEVRWPTAVPAYLWDSPGRVEFELLSIRTRPSAVLRTLFAQKVDTYNDVIPALLLALTIAIFIAEATSLIIGVSITRTITGTVHDIYEGTERIQEGVFSHRIKIKGNDQLAELGTSFNDMTANIERLLVVAKESERLQAELEIAREVQNQLYPRTVPLMKTLHLNAFCNPARMVSGDYYDYQRLDEGRVTIAIGDVAGKGISAALLMATVQSALRTQVRHCLDARKEAGLEIATSKLVSDLNRHLHANTTPEKYATFCFGVYEDASHTLTYTNAGHLPPILMRRGETQFLEVNGTVVGAFPFSRYEESRVTLEPGDLLLFYTDGITEAENAYGEQFGEERLCQLLRKRNGSTSSEILASIVEHVKEWTGSGELQDDMTLLLAIRT
ncbi:MAG: PP2C family protein-serine/threonine phosphatase [Bryobacterales bacterium]|nr:PP2C family protein-serine/threonine phosphatase [Bryobacterales bacterium]